MFFDEQQFDLENVPHEDALTNDLIRKWIMAKRNACVKLDTPIYKIFRGFGYKCGSVSVLVKA